MPTSDLRKVRSAARREFKARKTALATYHEQRPRVVRMAKLLFFGAALFITSALASALSSGVLTLADFRLMMVGLTLACGAMGTAAKCAPLPLGTAFLDLWLWRQGRKHHLAWTLAATLACVYLMLPGGTPGNALSNLFLVASYISLVAFTGILFWIWQRPGVFISKIANGIGSVSTVLAFTCYAAAVAVRSAPGAGVLIVVHWSAIALSLYAAGHALWRMLGKGGGFSPVQHAAISIIRPDRLLAALRDGNHVLVDEMNAIRVVQALESDIGTQLAVLRILAARHNSPSKLWAFVGAMITLLLTAVVEVFIQDEVYERILKPFVHQLFGTP